MNKEIEEYKEVTLEELLALKDKALWSGDTEDDEYQIYHVLPDYDPIKIKKSIVLEYLEKKDKEEEVMEEFIKWVASEVAYEEFVENAESFAEIACRKLVKLGFMKEENGYYYDLNAEEEEEEDERFKHTNSDHLNHENEQDLMEHQNEYLRIGAIVERFKKIDEAYNHEPWTLEQIFSNLNMIIGAEVIPKVDYEAQLRLIPVSERLPSWDIECLVVDEDGEYGVGYYDEDAKAWDSPNWGWLERKDRVDNKEAFTEPCGIGKVVAWLPLYKEKEE